MVLPEYALTLTEPIPLHALAGTEYAFEIKKL
jgi:hypothetical protein